MLDREVLTIRLRELPGAEEGHGPSREDLEARLAETGRKIDRLVDALAAGANARLSLECSSRRSRSKRRRGRRFYADTACLVSMNLKMVELRGLELEGNIVSATEHEILALPSSGRGRR